MIASLGDLLRATLERGSDAEMPLGDELRLIDLYMNIARVRFADRLKTVVDIPPELRAAMVPTLALQPLVENAVRHGIGETERVVTITISAKQQGDSLVLQVSDTGPGIPDGRNGDRSEGIGLSNTRSRLEQLYGARASLVVSNVSSGGAVATIRMPLRLKRAEFV
jgi:LytS/YehU family sensor histidine kinase